MKNNFEDQSGTSTNRPAVRPARRIERWLSNAMPLRKVWCDWDNGFDAMTFGASAFGFDDRVTLARTPARQHQPRRRPRLTVI